LRITVFVIVLIIGIGAGYLWWKDAEGPYDAKDTTPIQFSISEGDTVREVVSNLSTQKLIRSPIAFYLLVRLLGIEKNLQAGDYRLNRTMDATKIARSLTLGMKDVWVTILEGWRAEEVATKVAKELDIPEKEFLREATEGYMFPDTYRIPREASASAVVSLFKDNFEKKILEPYKNDIRQSSLSVLEIITLASIIEREGRTDEDRPVIAGILFNRMKESWPLETDATLQYALGYQSKEKTWWKKELYEEDKTIDSPFNTYTNVGLPPAPIANPGLSSIKAVLHPTQTENMFYIHDKSGNVHYAKTIDEHNANVEKYLR